MQLCVIEAGYVMDAIPQNAYLVWHNTPEAITIGHLVFYVSKFQLKYETYFMDFKKGQKYAYEAEVLWVQLLRRQLPVAKYI